MQDADDALDFLPEPPGATRHQGVPWLVLIVDDAPEVHSITQMVLRDFTFQGRPLRFISAFSAAQARGVLRRARGIAVCLLDVVMETNTAGLDLIRHIRDDLDDHAMRIILRTGQPGYAPEQRIIAHYDITDYKAKTELTQSRMVCCMITALRSYRHIRDLEANRLALADLRRTLEARVDERTRDHRHAEQRLQSILDALVFPVVIARCGDHIVRYANPRFGTLFGVPAAEMVGARGDDVLEDTSDRARILEALDTTGTVDGLEVRLRMATGDSLWVSLSAVRMSFDGETCTLAAFHDISERKSMELELQRLATTDTLTGLANRRQFLDLAERELGRAQRFGTPVAALVFDIDLFKRVNDEHGHQVGDAVLRAVATTARESLRAVDIFGRVGGEEFAAMLPETDLANAKQAAERLRRAVCALDHGIPSLGPVTVSIGVAVPNDGDGLDALLAAADMALYRAKRQGRNRVRTMASRARGAAE